MQKYLSYFLFYIVQIKVMVLLLKNVGILIHHLKKSSQTYTKGFSAKDNQFCPFLYIKISKSNQPMIISSMETGRQQPSL